MRTFVVLGASSFSGQDFIDLLLDDPENKVIGIGRSPEKQNMFLRYRERKGYLRYSYYNLDLNKNIDSIIGMLDFIQPEFIVNFAAQSEVAPSWDNPEQWFTTNVVALSHLINYLRKKKYLKKFLQISSPEVYGSCVVMPECNDFNPSTPYAASKASADLLLSVYAKHFDFPVVTVRSSNVYGARQQLYKIIPRSVIYMKSGKVINLHNGGKSLRSFIHIRDVSNGELAAIENGDIGEVYHLTTEEIISIKEVVKIVADLLGKGMEEVTKEVEDRVGQDAIYQIISRKTREKLKWNPIISLNSGVEEVIEWVDKNWDLIKNSDLTYQHKS